MHKVKIVFTIFLTFCIFEITWSQTNYCESGLCASGEVHIGCNNTGNFSSTCASNAKIIPITAELRREIVNAHNKLRNRIAEGSFNGYESAVRMATMGWSNELSRLAAFNVKRCSVQSDQCRNTPRFRFVGQNVGSNTWESGNHTVRNLALRVIAKWFNTNLSCSMEQISNTTASSPCKPFTNIVQEKNIGVGCAILRQLKSSRRMQFLTCNYAYGNVLKRRVYRTGPTASRCTTGTNPTFSSLCSMRESYRLNTTAF